MDLSTTLHPQGSPGSSIQFVQSRVLKRGTFADLVPSPRLGPRVFTTRAVKESAILAVVE